MGRPRDNSIRHKKEGIEPPPWVERLVRKVTRIRIIRPNEWNCECGWFFRQDRRHTLIAIQLKPIGVPANGRGRFGFSVDIGRVLQCFNVNTTVWSPNKGVMLEGSCEGHTVAVMIREELDQHA